MLIIRTYKQIAHHVRIKPRSPELRGDSTSCYITVVHIEQNVTSKILVCWKYNDLSRDRNKNLWTAGYPVA